MSVKFIEMKCPACGGEITVESHREFAFCTYCGSKIMVNNENEHIYRNIDEARIKEAETDRLIRLRELELEEKENQRGRRSIYIAFGIALAFVLIGALICIFNTGAGAIGIMIGVYVALFTFVKSEDKKKKKRKYVGSNEVQITDAMADYWNKNYNSIVMLYKGVGFANVTAIPLNDLTVFTQKKNGQVEEVTINGNGDFEEGDIFPKNSNVMITYHSR